MDKKINIVVIGGSKMAQLHTEGVVSNENANLYGICEINSELLNVLNEKFHPEKICEDYREFVNDKNVDAAVIVVPDQQHLEITEAFLRAGKDVLCEKPMALNIEQCKKMMQVEKETGRMLTIGQVCRCTPAFMKAKEIIDSGRIGELFFVESEYAHNYENSRGAGDWRVVPERHSFIGGACHAVDLLRWIAGNPTEVTALSNHKCLLDWPTDDCTVAIYKFPNNVIGKVFSSTGCFRSYTMRSVFYGTKGTIICDNTSDSMQLFTRDELLPNATRDYCVPQIIPIDVNNHNAAREIDEFIKAIVSGNGAPTPSIEGASTIAVCCASVESAQEGKTVKIEYPEY